MSSYKDFTDGKYDNLKFAPGLVMGWITEDVVSQTKIRYAVYAHGGRILRSQPSPIDCHEFTTDGCKWSKVSSVPDSAEFIGHYPPVVGCA